MDGIKEIADSFGAELQTSPAETTKNPAYKAGSSSRDDAGPQTVRSANLMELAAGLPREATGPGL